MRILVTGANGFIGSHLVRALSQLNHEVLAGVRHVGSAKNRSGASRFAELDFTQDYSTTEWLALLDGIDVVINAVGIIRETGRQSFARLHTEAPCRLFKACRLARVARVIQISALGADATAISQYHITKRAADDCLKQLDIEYAIVKPSLVYGDGGKSAAFFKALAALPVQPVIGEGDQPVQPIHIDDLTQAVIKLVQVETPLHIEVEAVGPKPVLYKDMLQIYRHWLGYTSSRRLEIPYQLALFAAKFGRFAGDTPLSSEAVQMLQKGNSGNASVITDLLGHAPRDFEVTLQEMPACENDRWHARLFFLRPALRYSIALLWLWSGIVSAFIYPVEQSHDLLARIGIGTAFAPLFLYGAAMLDLLIGIAVWARYKTGLLALVQVAVIVLYTVLISLWLPEYWLHPFGPVSKNVPLVVAILVLAAMEKK